MPLIDEDTYAFYAKDEAAAHQRFNEHLDEGHGIEKAIELVKAEFPTISDDLVAWWMN